jgi:hypothetical protein
VQQRLAGLPLHGTTGEAAGDCVGEDQEADGGMRRNGVHPTHHVLWRGVHVWPL